MTEACMAKVVASEAAVSVSADAMQIMGGLGYMTDTPGQRCLRDAHPAPSARAPPRSNCARSPGWRGIAEPDR